MIDVHVAQDANINNVVVNKPVNPHKIRDCGFFYDSTFQVIFGVSIVLDTFQIRYKILAKPYKIRVLQDEKSNERLISYGIEKGDKMSVILYTTHCPRCNILEKKLQ